MLHRDRCVFWTYSSGESTTQNSENVFASMLSMDGHALAAVGAGTRPMSRTARLLRPGGSVCRSRRPGGAAEPCRAVGVRLIPAAARRLAGHVRRSGQKRSRRAAARSPGASPLRNGKNTQLTRRRAPAWPARVARSDGRPGRSRRRERLSAAVFTFCWWRQGQGRDL